MTATLLAPDVCTAAAFDGWLRRAHPGNRTCYFTTDPAAGITDLPSARARAMNVRVHDDLVAAVRAAADRGAVALFQERRGDALAYLAVRLGGRG